MTRYLVLVLLFLGSQLSAQNNTDHLKATIIGSGSPKYNAERSGPSVLITYKNTQILVDMGNGTQANLNKNNTKIKMLDGLLFTHHHLDHNEEFAPIFIQSLLGGNKTVIAGPKQTTAIIDNILDIYEEDINYRLSKSNRTLNDVTPNYTSNNLIGSTPFYIGDIKVSYTLVNHTIETLAYRFDVGEESITISGDLTYSESLPILAKNTDYLIMDSGGAIAVGSKRNPTNNHNNKQSTKEKAHVNLTESSKMAKEANTKNLVLTHFNFTTIDEDATTTQIRKEYQGTVLYAKDLMVISCGNSKIEENKNKINQKVKPEISTPNSAPNFANMLKRMDDNRDGKISKTEAKGKLKAHFTNRDKNNDGYITEDELSKRNQ